MEREQASKFVNDLLRLMVTRNGSDLFLTADFPPVSHHPPALWPQFDPPPVIAAPSMNQSMPLRLDSTRRTP